MANPKLRFPNFDENWNRTQIGNVSKVTSGGTPSRTNLNYWGGNIPWVTTSLINFNSIEDVDEFITEEGLKNSSAKIFPKGTLLIAMYGQGVTRGKVAVLNIEATTNQACSAIIFDPTQVFYKFAFYQLMRNYEGIRNLSNDGGQKNLSGGVIKEIFINLPTIKEQHRITEFLSTVDKKISLLKEKHNLLKQYKKGVLQKVFSQDIRFKDDNGSDFPEWLKGTLGDLSDKISNKNKDESVTNVLTNSAKSGIVSQTDYFKKDIANQNNLAGYAIVEKNDFVYNPRISELAPVGPIKRNHIGQGVMSPLYTVFRFKDQKVLDYLELYFETTQWHRYMKSIANFGARHDRMNITMGDFFNLPISTPSKYEMEKIVGFVQLLNKKVGLVAQQIEQTQTFKKGLLQQMFV
jgi:type I restriction enzyme S subunit